MGRRERIRVVSWWLAVGLVAGGLAGALVGGVGGRLLMLLLRLTTDDLPTGLISDDGFEIGVFTPGDTVSLVAVTALFGGINGLAYVGLRWFLPPRWRLPLWTLLAAAFVGANVVHADGIDFVLLDPLWLAVAGFVALPGLAAALVVLLVDRVGPGEPWACSRWLALAVIPALPTLILAPVAAVAGAAAVALLPHVRSVPRALTVVVPAAVLVVTAYTAVALVREAAEIL